MHKYLSLVLRSSIFSVCFFIFKRFCFQHLRLSIYMSSLVILSCTYLLVIFVICILTVLVTLLIRMIVYLHLLLREMCTNTECFLVHIRNEYEDLQSKSLYSVRIQENMDQKKLRIWTLFTLCVSFWYTIRVNTLLLRSLSL